MSFEELGPTFVKLGQLLATRPDLVPEDFIREFEKLHAQVQPLPFETVEAVLKEELGDDYRTKFASLNPEPLGSASIAQVHAATLTTGEKVVVKVQRPGIVKVIDDDLDILYLLADLIEKYIPEAKPYNPSAVVEEFFKTLDLETNFIVEANNIRRFSENFARADEPLRDKVKIPKVYLNLTTERVLTMEALEGVPLSNDRAIERAGADPGQVVRLGLQTYLRMVFIHGLFHGDLHAGNFFILPENRVGLIDFGVVGRLNGKTQTAIASMLYALSQEDYDRLALEYVDLAPFTDKINTDLFARDLRELIAPFFGLNLANINIGKILMGSASIAARHGLTVPTELMLFFKSIVAIEGLGRRIDPQFDFLQTALEFAKDLVAHQMDPKRFASELAQVARESKQFINALPRQLSFYIRKINAPDYASRIELRGLDEIKKSFESSFNLLFLGLIIGAMILSGAHIATAQHIDTTIAGLPTMSFILFVSAGALGVVAFINYIRKP